MRIFAILKKAFQRMNSDKEELNNISYFRYDTVSRSAVGSFNFPWLTIEKTGYYVVLLSISGSISSSEDTIAALAVDEDSGCTRIVDAYSRGTMSSGGGTTSWGIVNVTKKNAKIRISSYCYKASSKTYGGKIMAIRLRSN
mgnify:CR=1 FL=1